MDLILKLSFATLFRVCAGEGEEEKHRSNEEEEGEDKERKQSQGNHCRGP